MKAFEELVEEVYQDGDLRPEFAKYAQLIARTRQQRRQMGEQLPPAPAGHYQFLRYAEIGPSAAEILPGTAAEEMFRLRRGITILSSTLFKTLSLRYPLAADELHRIRDAVAFRYLQTE
jgi:hypothetical protein